ncbi:uncharacterized protein LOC128965870 [Oppia nitens]|uniref:uncharacterized protein LOC128965870 n=1 Tax=Oppia nitens TaxID=1686743 RepID=UPI0023DC9DC6|nr:uncharacterized protein LOC128965870 [Oppia nitens]
MGIPIPVPLPLPVRPGQIIMPNGPQKGPHGPPFQGPQPVYPGAQGKHGGFPIESNYVEYGPEMHGPQQQPQPQPQQPQPQQTQQFSVGPPAPQGNDPWPLPLPEMPKIVHLDVKCEKNLMKVAIEFDKPFNGIIFSKGHYSYGSCIHLPAGSGRSSVFFDVGINSCGTTGNTQNGLYGYGSQSGSGSFFENTIVIQYDPQVQEVWDQARKLRCTWHDQYEKAVTFRPFPVDMLDVVRADFAGDNVGCWMQIQVGKGPWASEVAGIVKIGQTMTMVLAIKDDENKFDMLVRNCIAHDGKRAPIELVDSQGCIVRPKLMSKFTKIKNFGSSASVLSYTHFQAFKFPDSMEVHFQCTIQICRFQCPEQCSQHQSPPADIVNLYSGSGQNNFHSIGKPREERDVDRHIIASTSYKHDSTQVGLNRIIQVVSAGDLSFALHNESLPLMSQSADESDVICMSLVGFTSALVILIVILLISCLFSVFLCLRQRSLETSSKLTSLSTPPSLTYDMRTYAKRQHPSHVQMSKHDLTQIKRLRKELLSSRSYDKWSRPVKQHQTPTWLQMSISVTHLTDLDISRHVLIAEAWIRLVWIDEHLTWNPNDYQGLNELHFDCNELWKPDILLWNSADHLNLDEVLSPVHIIVNSNGTAVWTPAGSLRTSCTVDLTDYPNDIQECGLYFGSWTHNQQQINITTLGNQFLSGNTWYTNPEWEIIDFKTTRNNYEYAGYGVYTTLNLTLKLKRNTSYYYYIITLPSIASMTLILAIFWLPSHSTVRYTLGSISFFISLTTLFYLALQLGTATLGVPYATLH